MATEENLRAESATTFVVKWTDVYGRINYAPVDDPIEFYASKIADHTMTAKALKECAVYAATHIPVSTLQSDITLRAKRIEQLIHYITQGRGALAKAMHAKELTYDEAEAVRNEIVQRWPLRSADFAAPLPQAPEMP